MTTTNKQRVLLIHRYFWPDIAPYASLLRMIGERLADKGFAVDVLTSQPGYRGVVKDRFPKREISDGLTIYRVALLDESKPYGWRRVVNSILLAFRVLIRVLIGRYDYVVASTAPPLFLSGAASVGSKLTGARFIYHVMDIHPEIAETVGELRGKILRKIMRFLDKIICKSAFKIVVLSEEMRKVMVQGYRGLEPRSVTVLNNPRLPAYSSELEESDINVLKEFQNRAGIKLVFAGNIGRFQSLDSLIEAMALIPASKNISLYIFGSGKEKERLMAKARTLAPGKISFSGHVSVLAIERVLETATVGIVSIASKVDRYAFPSKVMNYLGMGCPILAIGDMDSTVLAFVRNNKLGWTARQGDVDSIVNAINEVTVEKNMDAVRSASLLLYNNEYSKDIYLKAWERIVMTTMEKNG